MGREMRESFKVLLSHKPQGEILGVEIGVDKGANAIDMLDNCDRLRLILVDPFFPNDRWFTKDCVPYTEDESEKFYADIQKKFEKYNNRVQFIRLPSLEAAMKIRDSSLDYVYIDAAHDCYNVTCDFVSWIPKLKPNSIIAGHDFQILSVAEAVNVQMYIRGYNLCVKNWDWWAVNERSNSTGI